jgi:hypothetical protein
VSDASLEARGAQEGTGRNSENVSVTKHLLPQIPHLSISQNVSGRETTQVKTQNMLLHHRAHFCCTTELTFESMCQRMFIPVQTDKHGIAAFYRTAAAEAEARALALARAEAPASQSEDESASSDHVEKQAGVQSDDKVAPAAFEKKKAEILKEILKFWQDGKQEEILKNLRHIMFTGKKT